MLLPINDRVMANQPWDSKDDVMATNVDDIQHEFFQVIAELKSN